jgi:GTP cyclohydrolase II
MSELIEGDMTQVPLPEGKIGFRPYQTNYSTQPGMKYVYVMHNDVIADTPIIRMHSSCFFGDVLGTTECDCGEQFNRSKEIIRQSNGILFYLDQEGRSHGIMNKVKEINLQHIQGLNTVEASQELNLDVDSRNYQAVADILKRIGKTKVILMTNNPDKVKQLEKYGITVVERMPLIIDRTEANNKYLTTKENVLGHKLSQ